MQCYIRYDIQQFQIQIMFCSHFIILIGLVKIQLDFLHKSILYKTNTNIDGYVIITSL